MSVPFGQRPLALGHGLIESGDVSVPFGQRPLDACRALLKLLERIAIQMP